MNRAQRSADQPEAWGAITQKISVSTAKLLLPRAAPTHGKPSEITEDEAHAFPGRTESRVRELQGVEIVEEGPDQLFLYQGGEQVGAIYWAEWITPPDWQIRFEPSNTGESLHVLDSHSRELAAHRPGEPKPFAIGHATEPLKRQHS